MTTSILVADIPNVVMIGTALDFRHREGDFYRDTECSSVNYGDVDLACKNLNSQRLITKANEQ